MQDRRWFVHTVLALAFLALPALAGAEGQPLPAGAWKLNKDNWQKAEGLLPDPVLKRVKDGDYTFTVVPVDDQKFKENFTSGYWAASEANEGKYELDAETC